MTGAGTLSEIVYNQWLLLLNLVSKISHLLQKNIYKKSISC